MLNMRFCVGRLRPIATGLVASLIWFAALQPDPVCGQGFPAERQAFIERVKKEGFDELVAALGKRIKDHNVIQTCSMSGGSIGPPSLYHSILCDFRVAKLRTLIAAMPEAERCAAAGRIFDLKIEELEKGAKSVVEGRKLEPGEEWFVSDHALCAVGAALMLCGEFCPVSSTLEKLEYAETRLEAVAALSKTSKASELRLVSGQGFDPLLEINVLLHVLSQRQVSDVEIGKGMTAYERNKLGRRNPVVWDLEKNAPIERVAKFFPGGTLPKVTVREGAYYEIHSNNPTRQQDLIERLKSVLRGSEPGDAGSVPKAEVK